MNSNEDSKRANNPKNPEVVPASPDVDTGDLVVDIPRSVENTAANSAPLETGPQVAAAVFVERPSVRRLYFTYGLLTVAAIVAAFALAYYFFYASQRVQVVLHSDPAGAKVLLDGVEVGTSPVTVMIKPGTHSVIFIQSGFQSFQQTIEVKFDGTIVEQKLIPLSPEP